MITDKHTVWAYIITAGIIAVAVLVAGLNFAIPAKANVITQGIVPRVATSSLMVVGPSNANTLFATSSNCTSRVITTYANPVMLSFTGLLVPNGTQGHLQPASTTVSYDNANFGCGAVTAWGFTASTSITVTGLVQ